MLSACQMMQTALEHVGLSATTASWFVGDSPLGGRGIVAARDISAGEILFVDRPLIYGPRAGSVTPRGCTVCWRIRAPSFIKCHICALTLCSEKCQNSEIHANDCALISRWANKIPVEEIDDTTVSKALTPIRALTLDERGKRFLSSLKAHESPQHGSEIKDLKQYFEVNEEDEEFMVLTCRVLDTNAFQIPSAYCSEEMSLRGLYPVAGLMNHSCMSNTKHSFDRYFGMIVKATRSIPAGAEVLTCYAGLLWGTPARRRHLYKTKHFLCACARCADPTERGTLLAALKCFSPECQGSILPVEPLKMSTAWRCLDCGMLVPANNICAIQAALGSLMGTLNFENAIELEEFLENRITKFVPRSNQIVVDLQCRLIWLLGETDGLRWHDEIPIVDTLYMLAYIVTLRAALVQYSENNAINTSWSALYFPL
ncbi:SET domain-containing protein SmydA-8, isoform B [Eumeta japonica]|uniref:SET domain-containing protein SmydA-8, isoform B n=1 Tax=Eumeta variegata TaxID=151549 RepID=A0A4C1UZD4_EUMVA|nr:SET domain-containing protein SmydA-8, isoform B [Eumeta japonica]